jgi:MinD superfamily P-loop ATPase
LDVDTKEYCTILTIERKIKGDFSTIADLVRVMTEEYRQNTQNQQPTLSNEGEMLLFQNQVTCYSCGKTGHCANECTSRIIKNSSSKNYRKFQGKCGTCRICGHTTKDCWTREENKSKRPPNWKKPSEEKMNISAEKKRRSEKVVEYCWPIKDLEAMLTDPDLWIADTGATVHSTANIAYANN